MHSSYINRIENKAVKRALFVVLLNKFDRVGLCITVWDPYPIAVPKRHACTYGMPRPQALGETLRETSGSQFV